MIIRPVFARDLEELAALDTSYSTDCVWQMEQKMQAGEVTTTFRSIRLPRPIKVEVQQDNDWLDGWQTSDLFLVAEEDKDIAGYLHLLIERGHNVGRIEHLAIGRKRRRQGYGTALIQEAKRWCKVRRVRALAAGTQTKNFPAISFFQKSGFTFWGFSDSYHPSEDISVFFGCTLG